MLRIYHVRGTRSVRPIWLCYELDLPIEVAPIDFSPAYRNSPEWRAISPAGKVPAMTDGGMTMFESGAMIDYIRSRGARPFKYHLDLEIINEKTPDTWKKRLF